jgi:hypothetical protein
MKTLVLAMCLVACTASPIMAAGLQLSIRDGRVTLDAQDVTVRQILTEWARIGKTRIINVERITGGPVTLKLEGIPEKQALDIILRAVPGYMALPRATVVADASIYDRILVMPTTTAVAAVRPQPTPGLPGGAGANFTQLRPPPPNALSPGMLPEQEPPADPNDDPAIAAAAAAGLVPVPAPMPGQTTAPGPLLLPSGAQPAAAPSQTPSGTAAAPANPFNAPGTSTAPTFTPPPPPPPTTTTGPVTRTRPVQPDR